MTNDEIKDVKKLYKEYLELQKTIMELKNKTSKFKKSTQSKLITYEQIEKIEISSKETALRKLYTEKAKNSKNLFNIKVYMGSYYCYDGPDSDEFTYLNDLLIFENDPKAVYRVFCDIENLYDSRSEDNCDIIWYSQKEEFAKYERDNTIIVVPNEDIKKSIIEASKYSDYERFHGINRCCGLSGKMNENIKFNIKSDIDYFGDLEPIQDYFFNLLINMEPEEAVAKLKKKYKPYRNFYNYNCLEKK